jgi:hypothetical protein
VAGRGRPSKIDDPDTVETILGAVASGGSYRDAARAAEIGYSTLKTWLAQAREDAEADKDSPYRDLLAQLKKAAADRKLASIRRIQEAAEKGIWQADAWWLERTDPDHFGRYTRHQIAGTDGGPIKVSVSFGHNGAGP